MKRPRRTGRGPALPLQHLWNCLRNASGPLSAASCPCSHLRSPSRSLHGYRRSAVSCRGLSSKLRDAKDERDWMQISCDDFIEPQSVPCPLENHNKLILGLKSGTRRYYQTNVPPPQPPNDPSTLKPLTIQRPIYFQTAFPDTFHGLMPQ